MSRRPGEKEKTLFTIRRMTVADKPAMLDIASRIWEGHDYLPRVFDGWVADQEGEFAAVLVDGRLVGCGKLTFVTPTDAWLEGLRRDPAAPVKGVAEAVARHFLARLARHPSLASIRFSTGAQNAASIHVNEKLGFRLRVAFSSKEWEGKPEELPGLPVGDPGGARDAVRTLEDGPAVLRFLSASEYRAACRDVLAEGWHAFPWRPELILDRYVRQGRCRGISIGGRLSGVCMSVTEPGSWIHIVFLDARDDRTAALLMDDVMLTARSSLAGPAAGTIGVDWAVPRIPRLLALAAERGLKSWEREDDLLVYELPLELLPGFAS